MALAVELPRRHPTSLIHAFPLSEITSNLEIMPDTNPKTFRSNCGFSMIELLRVFTKAAILTTLAMKVSPTSLGCDAPF